jgi:hypothetical protein
MLGFNVNISYLIGIQSLRKKPCYKILTRQLIPHTESNIKGQEKWTDLAYERIHVAMMTGVWELV